MSSSSGTQGGRGRRSGHFAFALSLTGLVVTVAACDRGPAPGVENPAYAAGETWDSGGVERIHSASSKELFTLQSGLPPRGELLFMDGRATNPVPGKLRAWADPGGARVVLVDGSFSVVDVLSGVPAGELPLEMTWWGISFGGGLLAVQPDGRSVRFSDGEPEEVVTAPIPAPLSANGGQRVAGVRSIMDFDLRPISEAEPLAWILESDGSQLGIGNVQLPSQAFFGQLANTGWVAFDGGEGLLFASAVRRELQAYDKAGRHRWTATWEGLSSLPPPRFVVVDGGAEPAFEIAQYGVAVGPDGLTYVLATATADSNATLLAFDDAGSLVRSGSVPFKSALSVDRAGRVFVAAPEEVLARTGEASRTVLPPFELPDLMGEGETRSSDLRGKVVVLNFWASWCGPCREEMPLLSELAATLDSEQAVVLGLNDDVVATEARAFVESLGGVSYPSLAGGGELRRRFGVRGLPYTMVLDREGRIAATMYGFGSSLAPIEAALAEEGLTVGLPGTSGGSPSSAVGGGDPPD